jgi:Xaa-Pro aminopeptidase
MVYMEVKGGKMNIHLKRMRDLQKKLKREKYSGVIINNQKDLFFLTGFSQDRTIMLVTASNAYIFLPKMFVDHFKETCDFVNIVVYTASIYEEVVKTAKKLRIKKIAFDQELTPYYEGKIYESFGFKAVKNFVMEFRMRKEGEELSSIKKACSIAAKAFRIIKPKIKAGIKEVEVAR